MRQRLALWGCMALLAVAWLVPGAWAEVDVRVPEGQSTLETILQPTDWFSWGADLRLRQIYQKNNDDFKTDDTPVVFPPPNNDDNRNYLSVRTRLWAKVGPFFTVDELETPNGMSGYIRMTHEAYVWLQQEGRPSPDPHTQFFRKGNINEVVFDNLWVEWQRILALPVSMRVGRQDFIYGRGWVILDGTPYDTSRTIYFDAIKTTLHFDEAKADLDIVVFDNKGYEKRLEPLNEQDARVSDYDERGFWLYLQKNYMKTHNIHAYYIYKDGDQTDTRAGRLNPVPGSGLRAGHVIHTLGGLAMGAFPDIADAVVPDYYAEAGFQWGREGSVQRRGYGFNSELGCALPGVVWQPRVHAGFEYLSGDEPTSTKYEGWDPVFGRWARWSEIYAYRCDTESAPALMTNLQRYNVGVSAKPTEKLGLTANFNHVRTNERTFNPLARPEFARGKARGNHLAGTATYDFNKYVSANVLLEYFHPDSYYSRITDDAVYARWELVFTLR